MPNEGALSLLEGLIPAVFLIIGMLLESYRRSQGRVLTYEVELMPVFRTRQGFNDRIQVRYGDVPVDSLYSCRVVVRNRGGVSLSDQPIRIELKENVAVLEERFKTTPELDFGEIRVDEESSNEWRRRYRVELINPGDEILVDLTVAGDLASSDVTVDARGGGLKCLPRASFAFRESICRVLSSAMWILLPTGLLLWLKSEAPLTLWNGVVPAILGNRFEYYRNRWRSPKKRLSYEIVAPSPVYTTVDPYRGKVSVEYMGRAVKDLHTCRVVLRNTGNRSLKNQNVVVWLKETNVLESSSHTEPPELEFELVRPDDDLGKDRRRYFFPELEPKDKVTVDFTFEGKISPDDIEVGARGELLKVEPEWEGWRVVSAFATAENVTWLLVGLAFSLAALLLAFVPGRGGMDGPRELSYLVYDWLVDVSAESGFFSGVVIGALGLALVAFVVFQVQGWWGRITASLRAEETGDTMGEAAARDLRRSVVIFALGLLVFACIMSILIETLRPGTLLEVLQALGS